MDIYTSTLTYEEVFARPTINTIGIEGRPAISFDGTQLYFLSTGRGGFGAQDNSREFYARKSISRGLLKAGRIGHRDSVRDAEDLNFDLAAFTLSKPSQDDGLGPNLEFPRTAARPTISAESSFWIERLRESGQQHLNRERSSDSRSR